MYAARPLLVAIVAVFGLATAVLPIARMRVRTGRTGVVLHRAPDTMHRLTSVALGTYGIGIVAWALLYLALGPQALASGRHR